MDCKKPKFSLVGAGPGDPELITLKGIKVLESADVLLYDALVDTSLLKYAKHSKKIFVGKRKGFKVFSQDEIHELIVKYAFSHGHVVRLKGGDPFVFGRGSEEVDYVANFNIETQMVPGISSATSVPASLGIAVTQRNVSESFWVITGTTSDRRLSDDLIAASKTSATIVILMGFSKIDQIIEILSKQGREDTPIAVIQNGTLPHENSAVGYIHNIQELVKRNNVSTPAIIVIGDVVKNSNQLKGIFEEVSQYSSRQIA